MIANTLTAFAFAALLESASAFNAHRATSVNTKRGLATNVFGTKRGQVYNDASLANSMHNSCQGCTWAYSYGQTRDNLDPTISFVPMLHDLSQTGSWSANAATAIAGGSKVLFSFNEPDIMTQANIDPTTASQQHQANMNPFAGQARIGAPAVSNSALPNQGLEWLSQWMTACNGACAFDFCNVHWYSDIQYQSTLFDFLTSASTVCAGKPIWLTEFAPNDGSDDDRTNFMNSVIPQLEALDYLEAYSYFWTAVGSLFTDPNTLSEYGNAYATLPTTPAS